MKRAQNRQIQIKEGAMAVKIFIKRRFSRDGVKDASAMLIQARKNAMTHKGYISTETLVDHDDPHEVVVVSMWQKKADWDSYAASSERQANEKNFAEILDRETEYQVFNMGM
jgi:heme-degrading monooxygenase HmoA